MSESRAVTERRFDSNDQASALTQAALWMSVHDVEVDSVVGNGDVVFLFYTEDAVTTAEAAGFDGLFSAGGIDPSLFDKPPRFTLVGRSA